MDEAMYIASNLGGHHDGKFGFQVYRCVYDDDEAWPRLVARLTTHAHAQLDRSESRRQIKDRLSLEVMENRGQLNGATKEKVRTLFKQWRDEVKGYHGFSRHANYIYTDQEVIDSVFSGDEPGSRRFGAGHPTAFGTVLDDQYEEQPEQLTCCEEPDDEERKKLNPRDEGYPAIDGCKREDVGWVKIACRALVPRTYSLLMDDGWLGVYMRPPCIVDS